MSSENINLSSNLLDKIEKRLNDGWKVAKIDIQALLVVARAAAVESEQRVCDKVPEYSMAGPGEEFPQCGECPPCRLKIALTSLNINQTPGETR